MISNFTFSSTIICKYVFKCISMFERETTTEMFHDLSAITIKVSLFFVSLGTAKIHTAHIIEIIKGRNI